MSSYGVMRVLHYQRMPYTQSKLVRCVKGAVLDVAVDIRKGSPTFGQHVSCLLTGRDEEGMKIAEQFSKESLTNNHQSAENRAMVYRIRIGDGTKSRSINHYKLGGCYSIH